MNKNVPKASRNIPLGGGRTQAGRATGRRGVAAQSREVLAELLWDERTPTQARRNLRATLSRLNRRFAPYLISTRHTLAFDQDSPYWLDVTELKHALEAAQAVDPLTEAAAAQLSQGLKLYRDDFLAGFHVSDAFGFEAWLVAERERLRLEVIMGLHRLLDFYLATAQYPAGIESATQLLTLDILDEAGHGQMMRLLALSGQRTTALAQYNTCSRLLAEELGVAPTAATTALYEQIRDGHLGSAEEPDRWGAEPGEYKDTSASPPQLPRPPPPQRQDWGEAPITTFFTVDRRSRLS